MSDNSRSQRVQRVERELFELLCNFLFHDLNEPLPCYASISAVEVTPDLRKARVFFRLVGGESETKAAAEMLAKDRPRFQRAVADSLNLKFCPVLRFEFGVAPHRDEVDVLLENLRKGRHQFGD